MRRWASLCILLIVSSCTVQPSWALQEHRQEATRLGQVYNLPPGLLNGICETESHWMHPTPNGRHGEYGLCQLKPSTVRMFCPTCERNIGNLHQGLRSNSVREVQKELTRQGYPVGRIDGIFGLHTHIAVTLFQEAHKLQPDGIVGPRTFKALMGYAMNSGSIVEQLKDPYKNMEYAARYLVWLREKVGTDDPDILAAAYNGGQASRAVDYMMKVRRANE